MIKILITLSLFLSALVAAQENKYEPVANKAEYYALKFLPGKTVSNGGSFEIFKKDDVKNELIRNLMSYIG